MNPEGEAHARRLGILLRKYGRVVPKAWDRYLAKLKKGEYAVPQNEEEMRCFVFSECLNLMREKGYDKPYQISVEDKEILEGRKVDLAVGWLKDGRFVAVELKHFSTIMPVVEDLQKLAESVRTRAGFGFFLMVGNATYKYQENIDLKALGIEEDGTYSWFRWEKVKPKQQDITLETLIVYIATGIEDQVK